MSELIKILNDKIGYTLTVILGFLVPGFMFIFIWNRTLFMDMDVIKLLLLSFGISFLVFIPNFLCILNAESFIEKIFKKKYDPDILMWLSVGMTVLFESLGMSAKLINNKYTIVEFFMECIAPIIIITIVVVLIDTVYSICVRIKRK
ncbi:MAG: hypothetical protein UFJ18_09085 [Blautia sp.]|nr:hypothetical protein [Blautia sp.]